MCVADTAAAVATSSSSSSSSTGAWAEALRRTLSIVSIVSAVSPTGVTLEFFHSGVQQTGVRREEDVVNLFQRAAAIMLSIGSGHEHSRFPGVAGLENIKAGRPQDNIRYLPESLSDPTSLCAAYNRKLPCLTYIITCGDQPVRTPFISLQ